MLILEYISTHGTPEWCAARMSARESKGPLPAYEQLCRGKGGHNRMVRHVRTPLYRPRGLLSGFEIVLHCVILPPFPPCDLASR